MARILVGVTGGIAAYKACELVRLLVRAGHDVLPVTTPGAERFVAAETFAALARRRPEDDPYPHLRRADLLVIAPLTANTLAKLVHGLADNLLTEAALAHAGPLLVAPAMNTRMWEHAATRANVEVLRSRGAHVIGPESGELAEGETGIGRMAEPEAIAGAAARLLSAVRAESRLRGLDVVVSAGGTREPLDGVRYVGNRSSGRMGVAVATEAARRGAHVTLLGANLGVPAPERVELVETPTAADMEREARARGGADVIVMAAAVADYRPSTPAAGKRAKDESTWTVELEPTTDILRALGAARDPSQVLVGFAAEAGNGGLGRARKKREAKNVDLVVFNDVAAAGVGFDSVDNEVVLVTAGGERSVSRRPKSEVAIEVLDEVERILEGR